MPSRTMDSTDIQNQIDHDLCPVCHEAVDIFAIGHCDHPICYRCSTRMRVLCDHMYCPICRTDLNQVYMVHKRLRFSSIPRNGYIPNRKYKLFFEDGQIQKKFEKLNEHRCSKCNITERNLKALQQHLSKKHTLFFCSLCVEHLKIFPSERKVYTRQGLAQHRRQGDKDDTSYKGHPLCQFCDERYMDNDELFKHLRKDHYYCHFCETDGSQDYYSDYADLKDHFRSKHYLCEEGDCASTQFTHAFRSKIDFQAHQANTHARGLSRTQAKQARTIDVDIQLAPRNRRRDRVVTAEDYQETQGPRSGGQGRGQARSVKDRFREEDMNRAIQASLSVMSEEKMKKAKQAEEEEARKTPSPELFQDTEHFPSLGKVKEEVKAALRSDSPANVDSDSEKSSQSLAQRLAKKSNQSVQHGNMAEEDFPSLLNFVIPPKPEVKANPTKTTKPTISTYKDVSKSGPASEDFPSLPSSKKKVSSSAPSGQWHKKAAGGEKSVNVTNNAPRSSPLNVVINERPGKDEVKKDKPRNSRKQTFTSENDFPSLSSSAVENHNTNWLKNVTESSKKKVKVEKPIDWFEVNSDQSEFSIENLVGDRDNPQLISETFKEMKKKKKSNKKSKSSDDSKPALDNTTSLDNIATSLLGVPSSASEKKNNQKTVKERSNKEDIQKTIPSENSSENQITSNSVENVVSSVERISLEEDKFVPLKSKEKKLDKMAPVATDFPALESKVEEPFAPVKSKQKRGNKLDSSDFPALSAPAKGPPPGFTQVKNKPPPGFDNSQSVSPATLSPPPGFTSSLSDLKDLSLKNLMDSVSGGSEGSSYPIVPVSYHYEEPKDFQLRNKDLVMKIKDVFQDNSDKFNDFKACSSEFRSGSLSALDYYNKCLHLIGSTNFKEIFSELLVLLPDIQKQQELLAAHNSSQKPNPSAEKVLNISGKATAAPWKSPDFVPCSTCQQILLWKELDHHISSHAMDTDYPTLSSQVTPSQGPGLRAWVKAS